MAEQSFHDRLLAEQMKDEEFRTAFERRQREIGVIDAIVNKLEARREELGMSKAELARMIGKNAASVRRVLTKPKNPELRTVVAMADALGVEVKLVPRPRRKSGVAGKTLAGRSTAAA